ncbi:nucleotidyltransferase family protein [Phaeobacter sp. HF9A]|uniref:nucleotidyltransferase family protein n=1 Tax=Phaeobacter sp. HF9A TaxID=2721561 RepID=UPI0026DC854E|nr:nucleotidyltransferase family protein [Phaeobacter sp. HF9A]
MPHSLAILLLAAGASSRMRGGDKLLEQVAGRPLLAQLLHQAQASGMRVFVTLPDLTHPRAKAAEGATMIPVPEAAEGMGASIRRGLHALPADIDGVMLLPADMPELTTADFQQLAAQFQGPDGAILRATGVDKSGRTRPGHPVLFPRRCFEALRQLRGDDGARAVLRDDPPELVALPAAHALTDLDTPEDWAAWRRATSAPR